VKFLNIQQNDNGEQAVKVVCDDPALMQTLLSEAGFILRGLIPTSPSPAANATASPGATAAAADPGSDVSPDGESTLVQPAASATPAVQAPIS